MTIRCPSSPGAPDLASVAAEQSSHGSVLNSWLICLMDWKHAHFPVEKEQEAQAAPREIHKKTKQAVSGVDSEEYVFQ